VVALNGAIRRKGNEVFKKLKKREIEVVLLPFERHADTVSQTGQRNKKNTFLDILN
jgi:hypothetical protein